MLALESVNHYLVLLFEVANLVLVHLEILFHNNLQLLIEKVKLLGVVGSLLLQ